MNKNDTKEEQLRMGGGGRGACTDVPFTLPTKFESSHR